MSACVYHACVLLECSNFLLGLIKCYYSQHYMNAMFQMTLSAN